jgi:uncharacterized protein YcfJ|tara:strand:+ start:445 stop:1008 length:564 start_codon:yes stop_codon:yes gene_type:complete
MYNFRKIAISTLVGATLVVASGTAQADEVLSYTDYANITNVEVVYRTKTVQRQINCRNQTSQIYQAPRNDHSGNVLGAIIGGVIGNQIGKNGGNRGAATVIGAIGGSVVGGKMQTQNNGTTTTQNTTVCDNVLESVQSRQVDHYRVSYSMGGQNWTMIEQKEPRGNQRKVNVTLQIMESVGNRKYNH